MKFSDRLKYTFDILKHPFDGFWCLKTEKIGTVGSACVLLALFFVTLVIRLYTNSYIVSTIDIIDFSIWMLLAVVIGVVLLYCIANWSLTTLWEGSGSFTNIFISLVYSLTPITLVNIPLSLLSQVITQEEVAFYTFFNAVSIVYAVFLLLAANMTIHEYTMFISIVTVVCTVIAMALVVVISVLFINLIQQVWALFLSIYREIAFRI